MKNRQDITVSELKDEAVKKFLIEKLVEPEQKINARIEEEEVSNDSPYILSRLLRFYVKYIEFISQNYNKFKEAQSFLEDDLSELHEIENAKTYQGIFKELLKAGGRSVSLNTA